MNTLTLLVLLAAQTAPAVDFSIPATGTVLRAGPGHDFNGVLTMDGNTVVRLGSPRGASREVFVAQGFPVYLHGDFVRVVPAEAQVYVTADRVNVRLLPAVEGNRPLGQLSQGSGPLVLLSEELGWVRVLAPESLPLFAPAEALPVSAQADVATRWNQLGTQREARRQAAVASWRASSPSWKAEQAWLEEVQRVEALDLAEQPVQELAALAETVRAIAQQTTWADTLTQAQALADRLERARELRAKQDRALDVIRRQETRSAAATAREARILSLGLRFAGRGTAMEVRGKVVRLPTEAGTAVYLLQPPQGVEGETLKLTASTEVARLQLLTGKEIVATGRRLFLATVRGPVLVLDHVQPLTP